MPKLKVSSQQLSSNEEKVPAIIFFLQMVIINDFDSTVVTVLNQGIFLKIPQTLEEESYLYLSKKEQENQLSTQRFRLQRTFLTGEYARILQRRYFEHRKQLYI